MHGKTQDQKEPMNPKDLANKLYEVAKSWPTGSLVWHRGNGRRGVITEYAIDGLGCVMLVVTWGANENWDKCLPCVLSLTRVSDGSEGEAWKDGEEGTQA